MNSKLSICLSAVFIVACISSCAQIETLKVSPAATGAAIQNVHSDHYVYLNSSVKPLNKLLISIVGTGGHADNFSSFSIAAANLGYHVISIDYKNEVVTTACSNSADSSCFDEFRQEIVFGTQVSDTVKVDSANSIYNRIVKLVTYLSENYKNKNWKQFIKGKGIDWAKCTLVGHSQGAGHAAYIAKHYAVEKALMLAGPQDYRSHYSSPAVWQSLPGKTDPVRYYALLHEKDPYDCKKQTANCMVLMQGGNPVTVTLNDVAPHEGKGNIFITNIATNQPHGIVTDALFIKTWQYILQEEPHKK